MRVSARSLKQSLGADVSRARRSRWLANLLIKVVKRVRSASAVLSEALSVPGAHNVAPE